MKGAYIPCFCAVCAFTIGVFRVKFYVRDMQKSLVQVQKEIVKVNDEISALKAAIYLSTCIKRRLSDTGYLWMTYCCWTSTTYLHITLAT